MKTMMKTCLWTLGFTLWGVTELVTGQLQVKDGNLRVTNSIGSTVHESNFDSSPSPESPLPQLTLDPQSSLKLSFISESALSDPPEPIQPHQAAVLFEAIDPADENKKDWSTFVKVKKGGKGKWELDLSKQASSRLFSLSPTGRFTLTLLLGHPNHPTGQRLPLARITFPSASILPYPWPPNEKLPASWEVDRYALRPEIEWTFKEGEKKVNFFWVVLWTSAALSPWVGLAKVVPTLPLTFVSTTPSIFSFLTVLFLLDGLIILYWTSLKLFTAAPYFGVLSIVAILTGREALGDLKRRRLIAEEKGKGKKTE